MPITALSILGLQLNCLRQEENKRTNVKVRRAATTKGTEQHRMTPIKTRSERKKGASIRSYTMRLLSVRSHALEAAHLRKRQQEARISFRNRNSQVGVLHCTTDRGAPSPLNRELPPQQAASTLVTGALWKTGTVGN